MLVRVVALAMLSVEVRYASGWDGVLSCSRSSSFTSERVPSVMSEAATIVSTSFI